jgi:hypothetical protein
MRLGAVQNLPRIFQVFLEFILIFLSYFYLLEGSKIFFMSSKHFIWIAQVPMCLWEFSWIFWDFLTIFRALKHFLDFFWNYFCTRKYFGKERKKPNPLRPCSWPTPARRLKKPGGRHRTAV